MRMLIPSGMFKSSRLFKRFVSSFDVSRNLLHKNKESNDAMLNIHIYLSRRRQNVQIKKRNQLYDHHPRSGHWNVPKDMWKHSSDKIPIVVVRLFFCFVVVVITISKITFPSVLIYLKQRILLVVPRIGIDF